MPSDIFPHKSGTRGRLGSYNVPKCTRTLSIICRVSPVHLHIYSSAPPLQSIVRLSPLFVCGPPRWPINPFSQYDHGRQHNNLQPLSKVQTQLYKQNTVMTVTAQQPTSGGTHTRHRIVITQPQPSRTPIQTQIYRHNASATDTTHIAHTRKHLHDTVTSLPYHGRRKHLCKHKCHQSFTNTTIQTQCR